MKPLSTSDLSDLSRYPLSLQQAARALWGVEKEGADAASPGRSAYPEASTNPVRAPDRMR